MTHYRLSSIACLLCHINCRLPSRTPNHVSGPVTLLCYRAGKNSCLSFSLLGPSPDFLPGVCFWIPLGDFRLSPRDSFVSHHLTSNPEYASELGAAFSTPAFSTPAILMVPHSPLLRIQSTPNSPRYESSRFGKSKNHTISPLYEQSRVRILQGRQDGLWYD